MADADLQAYLPKGEGMLGAVAQPEHPGEAADAAKELVRALREDAKAI